MKLEHANIAAVDTAGISRFVTSAFPDFRLRGQGVDQAGRPWCHIGNDAFYLAISTVPERSVRQPYANSGGLNHLGWEVDNIAALEQRMRENGFEPNLRDAAHPARSRIYYYDPDGNDWEFVQYFSTDPAVRNDYSL